MFKYLSTSLIILSLTINCNAFASNSTYSCEIQKGYGVSEKEVNDEFAINISDTFFIKKFENYVLIQNKNGQTVRLNNYLTNNKDYYYIGNNFSNNPEFPVELLLRIDKSKKQIYARMIDLHSPFELNFGFFDCVLVDF